MSSPAKSRRWRWLMGLSVFLATGAILGWVAWRSSETGRYVIATARFADGSRVDLLKAVVATELNEGYTEKFGPSMTERVLHPKRVLTPMSGSRKGGVQRYEVLEQGVQGEPSLRGMKITTSWPSLILLLRGYGVDGRPGKLFWVPEQVPGPPALPKADLARIEIWTGEKTRWQALEGPIQSIPTDVRAFAFTANFPRTAEKLRLRFTQIGEQPVEVEIDNPQRPTKAQPWKATDALPVAKKVGEAEVRLTSDGWELQQYGLGLRLSAETVGAKGIFDIKPLHVEDASGNMAGASSGSLFLMSPDFGAWRAKFEVTRGPNYPVLLAETVVLGEGEFVAAGQPVVFTPDAAFAKQFSSVSLTAATSKGYKEQAKLEFSLVLTGDGKEVEKLRDTFADDRFWRIFVDGRAQLSDMIFRRTPTVSWGGGVTYQATIGQGWVGKLTAGQKLVLALQPAKPPEVVEFLFDPSPVPAIGIPLEGKPGFIKSPNDPEGREIDVRKKRSGATIADP